MTTNPYLLARNVWLYLFATLIWTEAARAGNPPPVTDLASWEAAIAQANANGSTPTTITLDCTTLQLQEAAFINANVTIVGNNATLQAANRDRLFFIAGGYVTIENMTMSGGAFSGGGSVNGGGGGAGLGGAMFIGSGNYDSGDGPYVVTGIGVPQVMLTNVSFVNNQAIGGVASAAAQPYPYGSGGGGLGGNGGSAGQGSAYGGGGGGGGIYGALHVADGGTYPGSVPSAGIFDLSAEGGPGGAGAGNNGQDGASSGGGAGGGGTGSSSWPAGGGGGGGVNGQTGFSQSPNSPNGGGAGGFGGGGGGSTEYYGGAGGYGGGGGGGVTAGGAGGFGGGGGAGAAPGAGGFGAVAGGGTNGAGGNGFGGGGAIFVMSGASLIMTVTTSASFQQNQAVSTGGASAYGNDLFLGGNASIFVTGQTLSLDSLGGAGNTTDPNVANAPSEHVGMAQGGLSLGGGGQLNLTGASYYSGATVVNSGTLFLADGASEIGTSGVTLGQNNGDGGSLVLGSNAVLQVAGNATINLAQNINSSGYLTIGTGAGSHGAKLGSSAISGGPGQAYLTFSQNYGADSESPIYEFNNLITGSTVVIQYGPGTTSLTRANTYTGMTMVSQGTLLVSAAGALGSGTVIVGNGTLRVAEGVESPAQVVIGGDGSYQIVLNEGGSFADSAAVRSSLAGGRSATSEFLSGTALQDLVLQVSFSTTSYAHNDRFRLSDTCTVKGADNTFVLQLTMENLATNAFLGWFDESENRWINAIAGSTFTGQWTYVAGAYNAATDFALGTYGYDDATGSVWAVVDQEGTFAIVPEPSTWALLLGGGLVLATLRRRAREERTR